MSQQNETLMAAGVVALGLVVASYISKPEQSKQGDGCTLEKYKKGNDASCQFLNDPAVCFHENSVVELNNGEQKSINEVVKGDILKNGSKVQCVVKTLCFEGKSTFVNVNGLLLTPWHPVKLNGEWAFPAELGEVEERDCEAVYNFVLESGHVATVNGVEAVTLGHDFKGEVIGHEYFGSQKVVDDLKKFSTFNSGIVTLALGGVREENKVVGLVEQPLKKMITA